MKLSILILFSVTCFNAGFLSAHQAHSEKNIKVFSNEEIVTESNESIGNDGICSPGVFDNKDQCCCSEASCTGPGNNSQKMSCKNHFEGLSKDINLSNQNTKNQSIHNIYHRINIIFIKRNIGITDISLKESFLTTPTYISIQSFLI